MKVPFIPEDAPFSADQKSWLAGFLAGLHSRLLVIEGSGQQAASSGGTTTAAQIHILYGSQTGNAEALAQEAANKARAQGLAPVVQALGEIDLEVFTAMRHVLVITSTYGEGEMPDNAQLFWDAISASTAPRIEAMHFGVLAIGDTSYDGYCQAGKLIDMRLEQLGARRLTDRVDCDVDFEADANAWIAAAMPRFASSAGGSATPAPVGTAAVTPAKPAIPGSSRKHPYASALVTNRRLSGEKSGKDIRHFEFDLTDSGLSYEVGDALGVIPVNDSDLVGLLLARLNVAYDTPVPGHDRSLGDLLMHQFEIGTPPRKLVDFVGQQTANEELRHILQHDDKDTLDAWLWGKDVLDLLMLDPGRPIGVQDFVGMLRPLQHRAYSISSSQKAHRDQVHLTIAAVRYHNGGRARGGICSTYLSDRVGRGEKPTVFISPNKAFRVPASADAPLIMVGPGTGIAPFRAFLEDRAATGAKGRNWLFFGDQHRAHDFIYEDELTQWHKDGHLTRMDLAFSRDQNEKIYVQTRMLEHGAELYGWLQEGGCFYVCGDATRMARDVDEALHRVIAEHGGTSEEKAADYVNQLRKEKRYLRDVY